MNQPQNQVAPMGPPRQFSEFLADIDRGRLQEHLGFLVAQLVQDVLTLKKQATLNLKITLKPSKIELNALEIYPVVTFKQPQPEPKPSIFFSDAEGGLTRNDPNQGELPLKDQTIEGESIRQ